MKSLRASVCLVVVCVLFKATVGFHVFSQALKLGTAEVDLFDVNSSPMTTTTVQY